MVNEMRYGRNGSIQEKATAMPPIPASKENIGVMQHKEATIAANSPAPALFNELFEELTMIMFFDFVLIDSPIRV